MTSVTRYNIPLNRRNLKSQGKACYMLFLQPNQQRMLKTEQRTVAYTCTICHSHSVALIGCAH